MSETYTVRLPEELKRKMSLYKVEWGEEVRHFIEQRVKQLELMQLIDELEKGASGRRARVDSVELIREDRVR